MSVKSKIICRMHEFDQTNPLVNKRGKQGCYCQIALLTHNSLAILWDIAIIDLFTLFCYHTKCDRFLASRILYCLYINIHTNKQKIRKEEKRWFGSLLYTAISIIFTYIINSSTNVYHKRQSYSMPSQMVRFCIRLYMIEKIQQSSHHENK